MSVTITGADGIDKIQDGAVVTADIADANVTTTKIASTVPLGTKNLIINGDMRIAQRGTSAVSGDANFPVDRWRIVGNQASKYSAQQSSDVPSGQGFTNSIVLTSLSSYTESAGDYFLLQHRFEANNIAHLEYGTANAKSVTLSFWVKSSLTGTFAGALRDGGSYSTSYIFEYTILAANTWEKKTITISGPTTGTWLSGTSVGAELSFAAGGGSNFDGTASAWQSTNDYLTAAATRIVNTNAATLYLTGVQLEEGDTATSFEHRPYGAELALCERYYQKNYLMEDAPGVSTSGENTRYMHGSSDGSSNGAAGIFWRCRMRATPTVTFYTDGGTQGQWNYARSGASGAGSFIAYRVGDTGANGYMGVGAAWATCSVWGNWTASAEV